jgi:uncharacterized membrane protein YbhN (UPF0104 family)
MHLIEPVADRNPRSRVAGAALALALLALAALVIAVWRLADLEAFARTAAEAQPLWLVAAFALQCCTYVSVAGGWAIVLRRAGWPSRLRRLIPIALSKLFADQVLPTAGMGGNVLLVDRLIRLGCPRGVAVAALLVSMLGFYAAYALLALTMLVLLWLHHRATPLLVGVVTTFLWAALAIPVLALWLRSRGSRPLPPRIEALPLVANLLDILGEAPRALVYDRRMIAEVGLCNGLVFLLDAATLQVCLWALGQPADYATAFIALISASIAVTLAPLPLGLGSFEASCTAMLGLLGVPLAVALAATLLLRGFTLWLPLLPGLWLLRGRVRRGK